MGNPSLQRHEILMRLIKENTKRLESCTLHSFDIDIFPDLLVGKKWQCSNCHGEVDSVKKLWYEEGLAHGRVLHDISG